MALRPAGMVVDCAEVMRVATFWADALGWVLDDDSGPNGAFISDGGDEDGGIYFQPVPEPKVAKNRWHMDVRPTGAMAEEVERLTGLGATVRGFIEVEDNFWTQMRDPEGNEFCILRGPGDGLEGSGMAGVSR